MWRSHRSDRVEFVDVQTSIKSERILLLTPCFSWALNDPKKPSTASAVYNAPKTVNPVNKI